MSDIPVPRAILTDIEGTTSSIAFVHQVLFPFARERLADYVAAHEGELTDILDAVRAEAGEPDLDRDGCVAQLLAWLDADRKITPLKTLQGLIWQQGYADGVLKSDIYPDAEAGLKRWHARGMGLYVYSSGSVAAQKLLFGHVPSGDLTPLFSGWFDTLVGGKREEASYRTIAAAIGHDAGEIMFLSDVEEELAAARAAGMQVMLLARDGLPENSAFPVTATFDTILP